MMKKVQARIKKKEMKVQKIKMIQILSERKSQRKKVKKQKKKVIKIKEKMIVI